MASFCRDGHKLSLARIFTVHLCQNLIPCFLTFWRIMAEFYSLLALHYWIPLIPTHHLNFQFFIHLVCLLFIGHKDYNNQALIHIADTQIIQALA